MTSVAPCPRGAEPALAGEPAAELTLVRLDPAPAACSALRRLLSEGEQRWAARLALERDRRRFVVRRAAVRFVLARELGIAPQRLAFRRGPWGKPALRDSGGTDVRFSSSHSGELALIAVSQGWELGVDIERIRPLGDPVSLAECCLGHDEQKRLSEAPPGERDREFLRLWTRMEARLKAIGIGLVGGRGRDPTDRAERLCVVDLDCPHGHLGAMAIDGPSAGAAWRTLSFDDPQYAPVWDRQLDTAAIPSQS